MTSSSSSTSTPSVLITGCSSGIGRCTADALRKIGYRVFPTARSQQDVDDLRANGFPDACRLDLTDDESISATVDHVLSATNRQLYGLFNNAGYGQPGAIEDLSRNALRAQFETNLFGVHELTRQVIPTMRAAGTGRIILNSSLLGYVALPFRGAYNASKFAMEGWADTLRLELRGSGIFVSLIEPGPISSRFRETGRIQFERQIDASRSIHDPRYQSMLKHLGLGDAAIPFVLGPESVAYKVIRALQAEHPRARYRVTFPAHLFAFLRWGLPTSWLDNILARIE